jgi:hypothetical protein
VRPQRRPGRPLLSGRDIYRFGISPEPGSFEAVEDEVESELVLVAIVVAGLEDVLDGQVGEAGVVLGGKLQQEGLGEV